MAVRKAGDRWVVEFMQRGERIFRRLPAGTTKADAQQVESRLRRQIFDAVDLGKLPDPLLEKLIDEWLETKRGSKSEKGTRNHAGHTRKHCRNSPLSEIASVSIRIRAEEHLSAATRNRRLSILKAAAKYAFHKGYTPENFSAKIQLLPEKTYTRRQLDPSSINALLEAATTPRARALIAFGAYTGMRLGEILKLTPEDATGGFLRVLDTKTGEDRHIPIPGALKPYLGSLPFKGNWRNVYRGWLSARKRAGVNMRFHDLRHLAATAMANAGENPLVIADIMGHKSLQTTRKYTHPSMEAKARAMKAITSGLQRGRKKKPRNRGS